jgi:DNA invertase Pin-like site-specific DNA recombinase
LLDYLKASELKFRSLTESIDTETAAATVMCQMIGALAQLKRSMIMIAERTRAGLRAPQVRGWPLGRTPKLSAEQLAYAYKLIEDGLRPMLAARLLFVGRGALDRALATA